MVARRRRAARRWARGSSRAPRSSLSCDALAPDHAALRRPPRTFAVKVSAEFRVPELRQATRRFLSSVPDVASSQRCIERSLDSRNSAGTLRSDMPDSPDMAKAPNIDGNPAIRNAVRRELFSASGRYCKQQARQTGGHWREQNVPSQLLRISDCQEERVRARLKLGLRVVAFSTSDARSSMARAVATGAVGSLVRRPRRSREPLG